MSTIAAGTTSGTALVQSGDTTGQLVLQTNGTTTAVTIGTNQVVTLAQPLPVASGGTGATSLSGITVGTATSATTATNLAGGGAGQVPYNSASGTTAFLAAGTSGQVLQSNGTSAPSWGTVGVAAGGTGSTSLAANNVLLGNGTSALQVVAPGSNGNILTSNGTTWVSQAPVSSSALTLISSGTFSSVVYLTLSSGISSTYKRYLIKLSKMYDASGGGNFQPWLRFTYGSTGDANATYYGNSGRLTGGGYLAAGYNTQAYVTLSRDAIVGAGVLGYNAYAIEIDTSWNASPYYTILGTYTGTQYGYGTLEIGSFYYYGAGGANQTITGIQLFTSTFTPYFTGTYALYGLS